MYIPDTDNRSKGEQTYYQYRKGAGTYSLNNEALEALSYPSEGDLDFVTSTETLTADNYEAFLKKRRELIVNKFINQMYQ